MGKNLYMCNSCYKIMSWDELLYHQYCPHCGSEKVEETVTRQMTDRELYLEKVRKVIRKANGENL